MTHDLPEAAPGDDALSGAPEPWESWETSLVLGSLAFGVGWGLAGFCPGPALVALGTGSAQALVFAIAMVAGMWTFQVIERTR